MEKAFSRGRERLSELTPREVDVIKLIAKGYTNQQIADELFISPHTAKNHVSNIYRKLGIDDRTRVALIAIQAGLVSLDR
ncbi:MAG TPA: response regulator transcription factor [Limnochordia bacterium]|nr:response regulator transcription factor [Limnochordia bacterium]